MDIVSYLLGKKSGGGGSNDKFRKLLTKTITELTEDDFEGDTSIPSYACAACRELTKVNIPETVTSIGDNAFTYCIKLVELTIPETVESIGTSAFNGIAAKRLRIPKNVKTIRTSAFVNCKNVEEIYYDALSIPDFVKTDKVFGNIGENTDGAKIIVGKNVTYIPEYLFYNNYTGYQKGNIRTIVFETPVKSMGAHWLEGHPIEEVYYPSLEDWLNIHFVLGSASPLFGKTGNRAKLYINNVLLSELNDFNIPNSINAISEYAFYNCGSLTSIHIPYRVASVGPRSFYGCSSLITATLENGEFLQDYIFGSCTSLTTVHIGSGYETTASVPFQSCKNLTNLTILDIKASLQVGSGTSYGHKLTIESLLGLVAECVKGLNCTLTVGSDNTAKLAQVYVKLTEDDGSGKLPFEQCESTDEGALSVSDYLALKNWTIA